MGETQEERDRMMRKREAEKIKREKEVPYSSLLRPMYTVFTGWLGVGGEEGARAAACRDRA